MKSNHWLLTVALTFIVLQVKADSWIRINQLGYLPQYVKVAVFMSEEPADIQEYALIDAFTGQTVRTFNSTKATGKMGLMKSTYRLDFSDFNQTGTYYLKAGKAVSPRFPINNHVYNVTADFLLNYMRQQRCGYNPFLKDSCHVLSGLGGMVQDVAVVHMATVFQKRIHGYVLTNLVGTMGWTCINSFLLW